jgi:hypothetical protein
MKVEAGLGKRRLAAWSIGVLLIGACAGEGEERAAAPDVSARRSSVFIEAAPADRTADPSPAALRALPAVGEAIVEASDGDVTVLSNQAPRIEVLRQLESATGFELSVGRLSQAESGPITVRAVGVPLGEALVQVLEGVSFQLHYAVDAELGGHLLSRVAVGEAGRRGRLAPPDRKERRAARRAQRDDPAAEIARAERRAEAERRSAERSAQAFRQLDASDPRLRAEGAGQVSVDREGVARLAEILSADPAPAVRAAAAERLSDADSHAAVSQLLVALRDPNSEVVITAIDALEWVGDESTIPELSFLLQHPDPVVRERTIEAIEYLE